MTPGSDSSPVPDLATLARTVAGRHPDRPALTCDGRTRTHAEIHERSCRLAGALRERGVAAGARVATLGDNCPESLELILGLALGGYVRSSLYAHNSAEQNAQLLDMIGAEVLVVQGRYHPIIAPHLDAAPGVRLVLVHDGPVPDGAIDYDAALAAAPGDDPGHVASAADPQTLRFSAGTTGRAKGILHDVAGWTALGEEMRLVMPPLGPDDCYVVAGPLTHASVMPVAPVLWAGGSLLLLRAFDAGELLAAVARHRATIGFGVPTMVTALARHPDAPGTDLGSLRVLIYGGSPITETALAEARAVLGDVLCQLYGQSEGAPLTWLSPDDHVAAGGRWSRSAGRPTPGTRISVLDDDGRPLPAGEIGEIAAHTATAFAAIWGDADATRARFSDEGFVLTRDMGYVDEDGFLFLTDRKEDMIISGGFNIWPAELENALCAHPGVAEAAVVGVPHERWGETPIALVVRAPDAEVDEDELVAWTRERLGPVKRVTAVHFGAELPKTPVGKVLRREVRALHATPNPEETCPA